MNRKPLLFWVLGLLFALGLSFGLRRWGPKGATSQPSGSNGLFDHQAPSASLPSARPRNVQSLADGPVGRGGMPSVSQSPSKDNVRSSRLGVNVAPRPEAIFTSGRRTFRWLETVAALAEDKAGSLDVIERRSGFAFVRVEPGSEPPAGSFPVAFEPRTGGLLVVTGKLSVHLKSAAAGVSLSQEYSLDLLRSIARLNTVTYQSSPPSLAKLTQLLTALRKDSRVVKADLEMLGEARTAQ